MLTRRSFIRESGLYVVALGPVASSVSGCSARRFVDDPAFALAAVVADSALCVGCRRCEMTCSALHHPGRVWPEMALLGVDGRAEERRFIDGQWFAEVCHQCPFTLGADGGEEPPPCMAACPTDAIHVAETGRAGDLRLRIVDSALCDGCGLCIEPCPAAAPKLAPDGTSVAICDLCASRPEGPACVEGCPSSALQYHEPWRRFPARPFPWEGSA